MSRRTALSRRAATCSLLSWARVCWGCPMVSCYFDLHVVLCAVILIVFKRQPLHCHRGRGSAWLDALTFGSDVLLSQRKPVHCLPSLRPVCRKYTPVQLAAPCTFHWLSTVRSGVTSYSSCLADVLLMEWSVCAAPGLFDACFTMNIVE